jgi:hypothetical protein
MRMSAFARSAAAVAAAGVAVAGVGIGAITGTANAATTHHPSRATVLRVSSAKDSIRGTLYAGKAELAKEVVDLDTVAGKKLTVAGHAVTNRAGQVAFTVKPKGTVKYELVFAGQGGFAGSHSSVVTIKAAKPAKSGGHHAKGHHGTGHGRTA